MAIPVNPDGEFEAVTDGGDVVGTGRVAVGVVEFTYGDPDGDGQRPDTVVLPEAEFEAVWEHLPQSRVLTLQAAGG